MWFLIVSKLRIFWDFHRRRPSSNIPVQSTAAIIKKRYVGGSLSKTPIIEEEEEETPI